MSKQLFTNRKAQRGSAIVSIPMYKLYALMFGRLNLIRGIDPDAVCQQICVEIEKQQGTYPNIGGAMQRMGRATRDVPTGPVEVHDYAEMDEDLQSLMDRDRE